jgi:hypothetical protein
MADRGREVEGWNGTNGVRNGSLGVSVCLVGVWVESRRACEDAVGRAKLGTYPPLEEEVRGIVL